MGCTSSSFSNDPNGTRYWTNIPGRSAPCKRNFSSRVDCMASSSGLSTKHSSSNNSSERYCTTSAWSNCSTPASLKSSSTPTKRTQLLSKRPAFLKLSPKKTLTRLTQNVEQKIQQKTSPPTQHKDKMEQSIGYFTGSSEDLKSGCSSFSYNSLLLHTKDISTPNDKSYSDGDGDGDDSEISLEKCSNQSVSNLKMEILMVRENMQLMPKTSSPFCTRRGLSRYKTSSNEASNIKLGPPSETYCLWRQYLQDAPAYAFGNVTDIPEAIAGQFSPQDHPAYTDLRNFEYVSAPKRYRLDVKKGKKHAAPRVPLAAVVPRYSIARPIISTEL